jgi:oligoribonuclease
MIDLKLSPSTKLLWLDLEMTGLDPQVDRILEVSAQITDYDFNPLATYSARIKNDRAEIAALMQKNDFWAKFPANRDYFLDSSDSAKPSEQIEAELVALISEQFQSEPAILAGNSVYNDKGFIKQYWPKVEKLLHYRMLDVSSFKILMRSKYGVEYDKKETHRALDDINESIAELKFYIDYFGPKKNGS